MANRNLADEVDALAKGLASLRAANKRLAARFATFEAKRNDEVVSLEIPVADFERSMAASAAKSAAAAEWREAYDLLQLATARDRSVSNLMYCALRRWMYGDIVCLESTEGQVKKVDD